jgi:hypothetical protein
VIKNVAPQSENYKVEQIHFHWGHANDNINGSEHLYEGKAYPLEVRLNYSFYNLSLFPSKMHIVSYSNWYSSISDAMTNTRSLAVVGLFFEVTNSIRFFSYYKIIFLISSFLKNRMNYFNLLLMD